MHPGIHTMKRCSTPSVTGKMQIKTMRRHHYTLTTMVDVKKANDTSVGEDVSNCNSLALLVGMQNGKATVDPVWLSLTYDPPHYPIPKEMRTFVHTDQHPMVTQLCSQPPPLGTIQMSTMEEGEPPASLCRRGARSVMREPWLLGVNRSAE